ncbi:MAG: protein translocase subunit SecD [Gemmataceae bacterium]
MALAIWVVSSAYQRYVRGEGGFKLGVDLVGGTILVYEVDPERKSEDFDLGQLVDILRGRIDPNGVKNITLRPAGDERVEIILPTGGTHLARIEQQRWQELLTKVQENYPQTQGKLQDLERGDTQGLIESIRHQINAQKWNTLLRDIEKQWPKVAAEKLAEINVGDTGKLTALLEQEEVAPAEEVKKFVQSHYQPVSTDEYVNINKFVNANYTDEKKDFTAEEVQRIKELIKRQGQLQFRILANTTDDKEAIDIAQEYYKGAADNPELKQRLDRMAREGLLPPVPEELANGTLGHHYEWIEIGPNYRKSLGLLNENQKNPDPTSLWQRAAAARERGETLLVGPNLLLYSREATSRHLSPENRPGGKEPKLYEYFLLTRKPVGDDSTDGLVITGNPYRLVSAQEDVDRHLKRAVNFRFNTAAGDRFYDITYANRPTGQRGSEIIRQLAIILDGELMSAPNIQSPIRESGQITGDFSAEEVKTLVDILRSGALPATIKPKPVSENTIGPTLGADTIRAGSLSITFAFAIVLFFMIAYYRFAGVVASIALLSNLVLTVAFMVLVQATFTLPGLAGLVLTLGMAVDANILIYERIREERDRGASLALAIRNGYERSFATIVDTHLSSIFTAIVLYAVGNDQLKGFGIALAVGLTISMYTSLYMTRTIFDIWQVKGWLRKLSMFRFFSRPNIDFMAIRNYCFATTVVLTILAMGLFLVRGPKGLNIDFIGGTAYTGQLTEPLTIGEIRKFFEDKAQAQNLVVIKVEEDPDAPDPTYHITYQHGDTPTTETVQIDPQQVMPDLDTRSLADLRAKTTKEEREAEIQRRASYLPDVSVEQIFLTTATGEGGRSPYFTVRTSEKAPELVQAAIYQLLGGQGGKLKTKQMNFQPEEVTERKAVLVFDDPAAANDPQRYDPYASPAQVSRLLTRELAEVGITQQFTLTGHGEKDGRYKEMVIEFFDPVDRDQFLVALRKTETAFEAGPQPERLENFDSQLAAQTQAQALWAILASWVAILLYLWFRFGNWTFGLAAVLCLIHDLCFTLGIIAICHYVSGTWLGNLLLIQDFKLDLAAVAALLTLVGYSVNDTIVVFDRIREVRGKNPDLTPPMINDAINQTLSRTLLASLTTFLVVIVLYIWGGEGVHLFSFVMVVGVIIGTYSSIYVASPLLLIFGEGKRAGAPRERQPKAETVPS